MHNHKTQTTNPKYVFLCNKMESIKKKKTKSLNNAYKIAWQSNTIFFWVSERSHFPCLVMNTIVLFRI
jgi:hypothetical protein